MARRMRRVTIAMAAASCLVAAAPAHAGLTDEGRCKDGGAAPPAPAPAPGLLESDSVVVAPGGGQVYSTSAFDAAVGTFTRDAGTGALTFSSCWSNNAVGDSGCTSRS